MVLPTRLRPAAGRRTAAPLTVRATSSTGSGTKVIVQGRHLEITDPIREYCEKKIGKAAGAHTRSLQSST